MFPSVLLLDKVFMKPRRASDPLRGVELFNLLLARDLLALGHAVTFPAAASWASTMRGVLGDFAPAFVGLPALGSPMLTALHGVGFRVTQSHDVLLVGNVGNGLGPALQWLRRRRRFSRVVLIAHREASAGFVRILRDLPGHILAVNGVIAAPFVAAGHPSVHVDYGILNADAFYPAPPPARDSHDAPVRFCVLGALDNAWKGADTALAAFAALPATLRGRAELHLAAYTRPPVFADPRIVVHPWMAAEAIPGFLRGMDVMLAPSRDEGVMRETFSQAVVQGMLSGLPILHSPLPILAEKCDAGGGICCAAPGQYAAAMTALIQDPPRRRRLGAEARATALARYVWSTPRFSRRYLRSPGG